MCKRSEFVNRQILTNNVVKTYTDPISATSCFSVNGTKFELNNYDYKCDGHVSKQLVTNIWNRVTLPLYFYVFDCGICGEEECMRLCACTRLYCGTARSRREPGNSCRRHPCDVDNNAPRLRSTSLEYESIPHFHLLDYRRPCKTQTISINTHT